MSKKISLKYGKQSYDITIENDATFE
jgi:rubrerythrin